MGFLTGNKAAQPMMTAPAAPVTNAEPAAVETEKDKARRLGRAALVATSSRGILGSPSTAREVLSAF